MQSEFSLKNTVPLPPTLCLLTMLCWLWALMDKRNHYKNNIICIWYVSFLFVYKDSLLCKWLLICSFTYWHHLYARYYSGFRVPRESCNVWLSWGKVTDFLSIQCHLKKLLSESLCTLVSLAWDVVNWRTLSVSCFKEPWAVHSRHCLRKEIITGWV